MFNYFKIPISCIKVTRDIQVVRQEVRSKSDMWGKISQERKYHETVNQINCLIVGIADKEAAQLGWGDQSWRVNTISVQGRALQERVPLSVFELLMFCVKGRIPARFRILIQQSSYIIKSFRIFFFRTKCTMRVYVDISIPQCTAVSGKVVHSDRNHASGILRIAYS